uniref:Uncharacterized protein n=1 Tax=Lactuca sativa TaxID=4236 RepID=A0A9R1V097_LACSA|nr:hypothetical protein LSAT_V11C700379230 [Lactuca sativa]
MQFKNAKENGNYKERVCINNILQIPFFTNHIKTTQINIKHLPPKLYKLSKHTHKHTLLSFFLPTHNSLLHFYIINHFNTPILNLFFTFRPNKVLHFILMPRCQNQKSEKVYCS